MVTLLAATQVLKIRGTKRPPGQGPVTCPGYRWHHRRPSIALVQRPVLALGHSYGSPHPGKSWKMCCRYLTVLRHVLDRTAQYGYMSDVRSILAVEFVFWYLGKGGRCGWPNGTIAPRELTQRPNAVAACSNRICMHICPELGQSSRNMLIGRAKSTHSRGLPSSRNGGLSPLRDG